MTIDGGREGEAKVTTSALRPLFSEYNASRAHPRTLVTQESRAGSALEYLADIFTRYGRTLEILLSTDLLCHIHALFWSYKPLAGLPEVLDGLWVTSQILLATN